MTLPMPPSKYDLVVGNKRESQLLNQRTQGQCLLFEGNNYYVLKLMLLPQFTYFLAKNRDSSTHYTIFARRLDSPDGVRLQNRVGEARLDEDLKTHLEMHFELFPRPLYMSLFPTE